MNREYHRWWSRDLQRDMELLVFGHAGTKVLVFPTSMGRYFEYEDNQMVAAVADRIEAGQLQIYCVDSVDGESWYNQAGASLLARATASAIRALHPERCAASDVGQELDAAHHRDRL